MLHSEKQTVVLSVFQEEAGSPALSWAWIHILVFFWKLLHIRCFTQPFMQVKVGSYYNVVHKLQLCTSAFLTVAYSRQALHYQ